MNLQQIETFVRVVEAGSFSKAAVLLDMAQPALSRQVRALEMQLRETLLIRTGRGVQPTDAGRRLLEHGHAILQRVALAKEDLGALRDEPVGHITVGLPPSMARCLTLPLIESFSRAMPKARLALVEGFSVNIAEWLTTGRIDLGLVYTPEPHPLIEITPVLQENLSLIGPAQRLTGRASVPFSRLGEFPLIVPQRGQVFRKLIEAQAALLQVKLDVAWEVSSVPAILDLVRGGHGFAALTNSAMRGDMGSTGATQPGLVSVPIGGPRIVSTLCLVQSAKKKATPLVRRTAQLLRSLSIQVCTQTVLEDEAARLARLR
ncbi:MAG: LysR family transcriptional regulator [Acidovorax sp.]|nr:LysR family transcriptional regulator [Acidovorax sp.]